MTNSKQYGFTLLELILVLAIGSTILAVTANRQAENALQSKAEQTGGLVAQYNTAVASYLLDNGPTTPARTYTGTAWLKDRTNCPGGTASVQYLPCGFPNTLPFNQRPTTVITNINGKVNATTTFGPRPLEARGGYRGDIASEVVGQALAKMQNIIGIQTFALNDTNLITSTVSTSGNNPSAFFRVGGTNSMLADLDVGGHDVDNANTVNARTLRANTLQDANHAGFSVDPGGTSIMNDVRASIIYDRDNAAYYVDPVSTSRLNITDTQLLRVGIQSEGTACSGSSIALDGQGKLLTCQGNLWKKGTGGIRISGSRTCIMHGGGSAQKSCEIDATTKHDVCYLTEVRGFDGDDTDGFSCRVARSGLSSVAPSALRLVAPLLRQRLHHLPLVQQVNALY